MPSPHALLIQSADAPSSPSNDFPTTVNSDTTIVDPLANVMSDIDEVATEGSNSTSFFDFSSYEFSTSDFPLLDYWWVIPIVVFLLLTIWLIRIIIEQRRLRAMERSPFATIDIGHEPNFATADNTLLPRGSSVADDDQSLVDTVAEFAELEDTDHPNEEPAFEPEPVAALPHHTVPQLAMAPAQQPLPLPQIPIQLQHELQWAEQQRVVLEDSLEHSNKRLAELDESHRELLANSQTLQTANEELQARLQSLEEEIQSREQATDALNAQIGKLEGDLKGAGEDLEKQAQEAKEKAVLRETEFKEQLKRAKQEQVFVSNEKMQADMREAASRANIVEATAKLEAAESKTKELSVQLEKATAEAEQIASQLEAAKQELKSEQAKVEATEKQKSELAEQLEASKQAEHELAKAQASLREMSEQLALQHNKTDELVSAASEQANEKGNLVAQIAALEKKLQPAESRINQLESEKQELKSESAQLLAEKENLLDQSKAKQNEIQNAVHDKLEQYEAKLTQQQREFDRLSAELSQSEKNNAILQEQVSKLSPVRQAAESKNGAMTTPAIQPRQTADASNAFSKNGSPKQKSGRKTSKKVSSNGATKLKPDDLRKIDGIGPKIANLLKSDGIETYLQLANASQQQLKEILANAGPRFKRHNPETWSQQARFAAVGEWEELRVFLAANRKEAGTDKNGKAVNGVLKKLPK